MKNNLKKNGLYKSLNAAFGQFKDAPPEKVWDSIEFDLAKKQLSKDRKRFFWLQWASIFIIIFFVSFGVYELINYNSTKPSEKLAEIKQQSNNNNFIVSSKTNTNNYENTINNKEGNLIAENQNISENSSNNTTTQATKILDNKSLQNKNILKENNISQKSLTENKKSLNTKRKSELGKKDLNKDNDNTEQNIILSPVSKKLTDSIIRAENKNAYSEVAIKKMDSLATTLTKSITDSVGQPLDTVMVAVNFTSADTANQNISLIPPIQPNKILSRLSVAAFFSPDYSSRFLINNKSYSGIFPSGFNKSETPQFAFKSGIKIGYDLSDKWNIQLGATYSYMEQKSIPANITVDTIGTDETHYSFATSSGIVTFSSEDFKEDDGPVVPINEDGVYLSYKAREKLEFINIPLIVRYQFMHKKISGYVLGGFTTNILINKQIKLDVLNIPESIGIKTDKISGLKKINVGLVLGMGFQYNIFKGLNVMLEPTLSGSFTSINKNTPVKSYPFSLGIATGIIYHF